jgi:hypothetical protein
MSQDVKNMNSGAKMDLYASFTTYCYMTLLFQFPTHVVIVRIKWDYALKVILKLYYQLYSFNR